MCVETPPAMARAADDLRSNESSPLLHATPSQNSLVDQDAEGVVKEDASGKVRKPGERPPLIMTRLKWS